MRPITFSALIGTLPVKDDVDTEEELVTWLLELNASPDRWAKVSGYETMLGRRVTVFEMGPAGHSSTTRSDGTTVETSSGSSALWVDVPRMMSLRHTSTSDAQSFDIRVTRLDYDVEIPDDRVRFEPPPGAREDSAD